MSLFRNINFGKNPAYGRQVTNEEAAAIRAALKIQAGTGGGTITAEDIIAALDYTPGDMDRGARSVANAAARLQLSLEDAEGYLVVEADSGDAWALKSASERTGSAGAWNETDWLQIGDNSVQWDEIGGKPAVEAHIAATNNPHNVTKAQLGLGNVANTADSDKPVSNAQQATINAAKAEAIQRANHTGTQAISTIAGLQDALAVKQYGVALYDEVSCLFYGILTQAAQVNGRDSFTGGISNLYTASPTDEPFVYQTTLRWTGSTWELSTAAIPEFSKPARVWTAGTGETPAIGAYTGDTMAYVAAQNSVSRDSLTAAGGALARDIDALRTAMGKRAPSVPRAICVSGWATLYYSPCSYPVIPLSGFGVNETEGIPIYSTGDYFVGQGGEGRWTIFVDGLPHWQGPVGSYFTVASPDLVSAWESAAGGVVAGEITVLSSDVVTEGSVVAAISLDSIGAAPAIPRKIGVKGPLVVNGVTKATPTASLSTINPDGRGYYTSGENTPNTSYYFIDPQWYFVVNDGVSSVSFRATDSAMSPADVVAPWVKAGSAATVSPFTIFDVDLVTPTSVQAAGAVVFDAPQSLAAEDQAQARANIGAISLTDIPAQGDRDIQMADVSGLPAALDAKAPACPRAIAVNMVVGEHHYIAVLQLSAETSPGLASSYTGDGATLELMTLGETSKAWSLYGTFQDRNGGAPYAPAEGTIVSGAFDPAEDGDVQAPQASWGAYTGLTVTSADVTTAASVAAAGAALQDDMAGNAVRYDATQTLTDPQKSQARANIGAAAADHNQAISTITGLQTALDGKAASSHTHSISDVTGLQTELDGKAASSHTHAISDVTGLQTALDGKAASSHTHDVLKSADGTTLVKVGTDYTGTGGSKTGVEQGFNTTARGEYSHAEGGSTTASGEYSHAEGGGTTASGTLSHAEGGSTTASGTYSHAEGIYTTASGYCSHSEGSNTTASGTASHAEGDSSEASGTYSHVGGYLSLASATLSRAVGRRAKAIHDGANVETDNQNADCESTAANQKTFRYANGYRFLGGEATFETHPSSLATAAQGALAELAVGGYLYQEDFGIIAGDSSDPTAIANAAALAAAIAASASQGKTLILIGTIYVSGQVLVTGVGGIVKGFGATIIQKDTAHNGLTMNDSGAAYGLIIEGLKIQGQGPATHAAAGFYAKKNDLSYLTSDVTLRDCIITGFRNGTNLAGITKFRTENVSIQNVRIGHEWNHMQTALLTNSRIVTGDGNAASACFKITGGNFFSNRIIMGEFGGVGFARFIEMIGGYLYIDGANIENFTSAQTINVAGAAGSKLEIKNTRIGCAYGASTSAIVSCELNNNAGAPFISITNIFGWAGSPRVLEAWGTYAAGGAPYIFSGDPVFVTYAATQGGTATDAVLIKPGTSNYSASSAFPVSGASVGQFIQFSNKGMNTDDWATNILLRQRNNHAGANQWSSIVNDMLVRTLAVQGRTASGNNVETSMISLTIPAGALRNVGESIEWRLYGKTAANANNKRFRFYWNGAMGGTPALDFGAIAMNDQDWILTIHVQRGSWAGGSGYMKVSGKLEYGSSILVKTATDNLGGDTAAIATHVGVLTDSAASDVICYAAKAVWTRAPQAI